MLIGYVKPSWVIVHFIELYFLRHESSPQTGRGAGIKWAWCSPITSSQMAAGVGLRLSTIESGNTSCEQIILRHFKNPASKPRLFSSGDNSAEGAGGRYGVWGLSPHDVKFDLWVWPAYLNGTIWGDFVSPCQACGLIKQAIKLFVGNLGFLCCFTWIPNLIWAAWIIESLHINQSPSWTVRKERKSFCCDSSLLAAWVKSWKLEVLKSLMPNVLQTDTKKLKKKKTLDRT